jgi:hypothetical protein
MWPQVNDAPEALHESFVQALLSSQLADVAMQLPAPSHRDCVPVRPLQLAVPHDVALVGYVGMPVPLAHALAPQAPAGVPGVQQ